MLYRELVKSDNRLSVTAALANTFLVQYTTSGAAPSH